MGKSFMIFGGAILFVIIWYVIMKPFSDWLESLIKDKKEKK